MSFSVKSFVPNWIRSAAHRQLRDRLFTERKPDPARIARMTATEPEVYVYCGHGGDVTNTHAIAMINPRFGSIYVNYGSCGLINRPKFEIILDHLSNPVDKLLLNPVANKSKIEELASSDKFITIPIKIHLHEGGSFVDNIFFPFAIWEKPDSKFTIRISGLISRKKIMLDGRRLASVAIESHPMTSISLDDLVYNYFFASEYPKPADILRYFEHHPRRHALVYSDLVEAGNTFEIPASALLDVFPGIHYNLLCRSKIETHRTTVSTETIMRRVDSGQGTETSALLLSYRDHPFLDLLEYVLLLEKTGRPLPSVVELQKIMQTKSYYNAATESVDLYLKNALMEHIKTQPPSTWRPIDMSQSAKNILLNNALKFKLSNSIQLLKEIGADETFFILNELCENESFLSFLDYVLLTEIQGKRLPSHAELQILLKQMSDYEVGIELDRKRALIEHIMTMPPSLWMPNNSVLSQEYKNKLLDDALGYFMFNSVQFLQRIGAELQETFVGLYRNDSFLNFLNHALSLEKDGRPLPSSTELQTIMDSRSFYNERTGSSDLDYKLALMEHMKTGLPSRWRPTDAVLNQSTKDELFLKAMKYNLLNSMKYLSEIGAHIPVASFAELYERRRRATRRSKSGRTTKSTRRSN
jgi:hypothetical protein